MTPQRKRELIDAIHRAAYARELALGQSGGDWKRGVQPRHDMVEKLNTISAYNIILSSDQVRLAQMDRQRQNQLNSDTDRSRWARAVGEQESSGRVDGERSRFMQAAGAQEKGRFAEIRFDGGGRRAPR
jgi:hypothetical protein